MARRVGGEWPDVRRCVAQCSGGGLGGGGTPSTSCVCYLPRVPGKQRRAPWDQTGRGGEGTRKVALPDLRGLDLAPGSHPYLSIGARAPKPLTGFPTCGHKPNCLAQSSGPTTLTHTWKAPVLLPPFGPFPNIQRSFSLLFLHVSWASVAFSTNKHLPNLQSPTQLAPALRSLSGRSRQQRTLPVLFARPGLLGLYFSATHLQDLCWELGVWGWLRGIPSQEALPFWWRQTHTGSTSFVGRQNGNQSRHHQEPTAVGGEAGDQ